MPPRILIHSAGPAGPSGSILDAYQYDDVARHNPAFGNLFDLRLVGEKQGLAGAE